MVEDPRKFTNDDADILAARRSLHADELFHRQGVANIIDQRRSVVKQLRIRNYLRPGDLLATLVESTVETANSARVYGVSRGSG
jgi:hypothetical protein